MGTHRLEETDLIDAAADEGTQVSIQAEAGLPGRYKLYVHQNGWTVLRLCKLTTDQIDILGGRVTR